MRPWGRGNGGSRRDIGRHGGYTEDSIARFKELFFDRDVVKAAVGVKMRSLLRKWGSYARLRARSLIRKRKKSSKPGQGPTNWTGKIKDFVWFAYDANKDSVVCGPVRLNKPATVRGGMPVPQALEKGFSLDIYERKEEEEYTTKGGKKKKRVIFSRASGQADGYTKRTVNVAPRPYMNPAFKYANSKLPELFR